jgi:uncharacterized protein (DUF1697 family)
VPAYIALLRGVNVSGQNIMRMEDLRRICTGLGFRNVETYVQSGNIVFLTSAMPPSTLANQTSAALRHDLGLSVPVLVKTLDEMGDVVAGNPFLRERGIDASKLHVTFLSAPVPRRALKTLEALPRQSDRFYVGRREIYLYCPDGYGRTKLSNAALEKALSVGGTTRNWKTVTALLEIASRMR